eukprot:9687825-Lingulodinium_polyedra.AAC.1
MVAQGAFYHHAHAPGLPEPLSRDTRAVHFQGRTRQIPRTEPWRPPKVHQSPAETHAETRPEERAGGR